MASAEISANLNREEQQAIASIEHVARFGRIASNGQAVESLIRIRTALNAQISAISDNVVDAPSTIDDRGDL